MKRQTYNTLRCRHRFRLRSSSPNSKPLDAAALSGTENIIVKVTSTPAALSLTFSRQFKDQAHRTGGIAKSVLSYSVFQHLPTHKKRTTPDLNMTDNEWQGFSDAPGEEEITSEPCVSDDEWQESKQSSDYEWEEESEASHESSRDSKTVAVIHAKKGRWTEKELDVIRKEVRRYKRIPWKSVLSKVEAALPGRSHDAIKERASLIRRAGNF